MKQKLLMLLVLLVSMTSANAQRSYTFNATALNVDGLPNQEINAIVTTVNLNPDGKNEDGATQLCGILANSGWDIVGFSEDFNFHNYLAAAPASTYYNFGKHSGSITTNLTQAFTRAEIDGLGIAVAKRLTFTGDTQSGLQVQWNTEYGGSGLTTIGDNGADNMIKKGFRMYTVTFATGVAVDVYVLHMDAETADSDDDYDSNGKDKNIVAREAQLKQLADYIKANHNNRPVIILGDTNCRYTREQLKTGFIDVINADSRFTINDAWVELMWGGTYPTYGSGAMMTHEYGMQKGEIVDKVFYINTTASNLKLKANSYLHDESVTTSDHKPVVVNFTLTDPNGKAPTDAEKKESWTLEQTEATFQKPSWKGEQVENGTTYYVMNVGTGKYIKFGGWWNAQAVTGYAGHPVTPTLSDGKYELVTLANEGRSLGHGLFMDNVDHNTWTLTPVGGTSNHYYIENGSDVLGVSDDQWQTLSIELKNTSDDTQKWIFLTEAGMRTAMADANPDYPFNFTPMLGAADFDVVDDWGGYAKEHWTGFEGKCAMGYVQWGAGQDQHNSSAAIVSTPNAVTLSQAIENLPAGNYKFSFEAFYNYLLTTTTITEQRTKRFSWSSWGSWSETGRTTTTSEQTMTAQVKIGSETFNLSANRNVNVGDLGAASIAFRDGDGYMTTSYQELNGGTLNVSISKENFITSEGPVYTTQSSTKEVRETYTYEHSNSVHFDNFRLEYRGTQTVAVDPYADYKKIVLEKVNETYPKVMALNAAGQAAYDITVVINRYNNDQIKSGAIAEAMCDLVDNAYANAYAAHRAKEVQDVVDAMGENGGDMTTLIINPSFETGDLTGWTIAGGGWDVGVREQSNGTFTTNGCDGAYLFNSYGGDNDHTAHIEQTVTGIPNGLYELKVDVTSFADRYVYIFANGYNDKVATNKDKTNFHEATLYFLVENGSAKIGAVGGNKGGGSTFIHYWPDQGCFFKADNFRLKYICDLPHGRLKLALDEANATILDAYGQDVLDLRSYQAKYDNKSLVTDGKAEVKEVYNALQEASKAQRTVNADMTWAITNPNFETGDNTGWACETGNDTKVAPQENATYTIAGTDGRYLFNTWDNGTAKALTQTVTGIPNGTYKLTAMVASDANQQIKLTANGVTTTIATSSNGAGSGVFPEVTCEVTDNELNISVEGVNGIWYKADNFHLTYLGHDLTLKEEGDAGSIDDWYTSVNVTRTMKAGKWNTFVVPFDMVIPAGWEVKELVGSTANNDNIILNFSKAESIKAGVPYMVRVAEEVSSIEMENINVTTTLNNASTGDIEFVGVYESGNVPVGTFFISDNKFYHATGASNTIKAFRAYLAPVNANIKAVGYTFDDMDATVIEGVEDAEKAEPVAVYGADGALRAGLQKGLNIVKMSDGKVKKVFVK